MLGHPKLAQDLLEGNRFPAIWIAFEFLEGGNLVGFRWRFLCEGKLNAHAVIRVYRANEFGHAINLAIRNLVNKLVKIGAGHSRSLPRGNPGGLPTQAKHLGTPYRPRPARSRGRAKTVAAATFVGAPPFKETL
jgi:hypothetical protein